MPLFEVAILEEPTKKELETGNQEKLVFGPKAVIAKDSQSAGVIAVMGTEQLKVDTDKMRILVRPFA